MSNSLRTVGKSYKAKQRKASRQLKVLVDQNPLLRLGTPPRIVRNKRLEDTWDAVLSDPSVAHSDPNRWRSAADVRPSSFPFCGRMYVLKRLGLTMPDDFDVASNFYTEIGKAVHYVSQNALARTGRLWGFWLCARPTCPDRVKGTPYRQTPGFYPRDKLCACGSKYFEYQELTVKDPAIGLRGHCDGILVYKAHSSVLEIKTSGSEKVKKIQDMTEEDISVMFQTESPWYGYWHQASTYAALLRIRYPSLPPITKVDYLIYSRDRPSDVVSLSMDIPADNSWWHEIRSRIVTAQHALSLEIIPEGFAKTKDDLDALPTCKWCVYKEVCLEPQGKLSYASDALYDTSAKQGLQEVLEKERAKMGGIIRGDVVDATDVKVVTDPAKEAEPVAPVKEKEPEEKKD